MMQLGCFDRLDDAGRVSKSGFSVLEYDIKELHGLNSTELKALEKRLDSLGLACPVVSRLMPLEQPISIHNPDFDLAYWLDQFAYGAQKAASIGAKACVFGCGEPRSIKGGGAEAQKRVDEFMLHICRVFEGNGMQVYIEALGPMMSDYLLTIDDVVDWIKRHRPSNATSMCDLRWMVASGDRFDAIVRNAGYIAHAHIDYPLENNRKFPLPGDGYDYAFYFDALKQIGYDGILTAEASGFGDFSAEATASVEFLRASFAI